MNKNLLIIPLFVAVLVLIFPFVVFSGDSIMVTTTTSMLPVLNPNDMIIVEQASIDELKEGDIIAFDSHMEMGIVAHRVIWVGTDDDGSIVVDTKGDNNEKPDPWYVTDDDLIGKVKNIIPWFGIILVGPVRYALVAVIIISAISMMKDHLTENKKKK